MSMSMSMIMSMSMSMSMSMKSHLEVRVLPASMFSSLPLEMRKLSAPTLKSFGKTVIVRYIWLHIFAHKIDHFIIRLYSISQFLK